MGREGRSMTLTGEFIKALGEVCEVLRDESVLSMDPGVDPANLGAALLARPVSTHEVQAIVRLCSAHLVSMVTHGGRTGLAGGAVSRPGQLVIDMRAMNKVGLPSLEAGCIEVEAGATLQAVQDACATVGCSPGIDLAARGTATIGGMISTNAGGMEAFRCGVMRHRVLGLEAVLADGTLLNDMTRVGKVNEGLDVKHLLIGGEGKVGIVTRAVLKLAPLENASATALVGFSSAAQAVAAFRLMHQAGGLLRAEVMWRAYAETTAQQCGLDAVARACSGQVLVLFEVAGNSFDEARAALEDQLSQIAGHNGLVDGVIAQSGQQAADFWRIREDSFAVERVWPGGLWYDVTVPLDGLDAYAANLEGKIAALSSEHFLSMMGHLGDGNLHITVAAAGGAIADKQTVEAAVLDGLKSAGGSISAEHGIGLDKRAALATHGDPGRLAAGRLIAAALDPLGLLNPGKMYD